MRQTRLHTPQSLSATDNVELTGAAHHYLVRVLRMSAGDVVTLFNGDGWDYSGNILEVQRQRALIKLIDRHFPGNESTLKITLVQAITRGERMDYSLQKATELGVYCIRPVTCDRADFRLDEKRQAKRLAHWQAVVVSACEQSGRAFVPDVKAPVSLGEWMAEADGSSRLMLNPQVEDKLSSFSTARNDVSILVGPEGGFSDEENEQARARGITAVTLGPRVLRTETAGPAAIAVLQAKLGDF